MSDSISKINYNKDSRDIYVDAIKIPIKKLPVSKIDAMDSKLIIDSKYLSKPESRVSFEKLWNFFKNSKKIRFFTSIQDPDTLISCTFESGFISVFVNCEQNYSSNLKNGKPRSCVDSSIIKINLEIYRIAHPELDNLIYNLQEFFKEYQHYLKSGKKTLLKMDETTNKSLFSKVLVKFLNFFNIPTVEKFIHEMEKNNHLNDDIFETLSLQNKSIEIQCIYP